MTRGSTRAVMLCGVVPTLLAALLALVRPPVFANLERSVFDLLLRVTPTRPPDSRVAIVDVDEGSLSSFGQWPWRRDRIGELVAGIRELGAAVVALDIIFAEPDREHGSASDPDGRLAETLRGGRVILGYGLTFEEAQGAPGTCVRHPVNLAIAARAREPRGDPFFRASGAVCNLPELTDAAGASGFLNAAPDSDGILRRVPLLAAVADGVYPSLALAAVGAFTGAGNSAAMQIANMNAAWLTVADRRVPVDGRSNLLVRYRGPKRTFPYVSAADVLSGRVPADALRQKLVLVGTTALGTRDLVSTPLDTLFTGVEVQATVADNLLQQDFIYQPEHGTAVEALAVLATGFLTILLVGRSGPGPGALGSMACVAAVWGSAAWLLATSGALLSPLFPTAGLAGTLALMTGVGLAAERRRADRAGEDRAASQRLMVQTLLSLTEIRDHETGQHSRRTREYARVLAESLATNEAFREYLTPERIDLLATLAPLHDIGKVGVPDQLLRKPGALTAGELAEVRKHPIYGRDVIVDAQRHAGVRHDATLSLAKDIVYTHHEKWDGTGYPEALRGPDIPIPGRVMALVDVYDAMRSVRPYSQPISHDAAVVQIERRGGTHFDPAVVDAFLRVSDRFRELSEA